MAFARDLQCMRKASSVLYTSIRSVISHMPYWDFCPYRGPRGISPASRGVNGWPPLNSASVRRRCSSKASIIHALIERVPVDAAVDHQAARTCPSSLASTRIESRAVSGTAFGAVIGVRAGSLVAGGGAITDATPLLSADLRRSGRRTLMLPPPHPWPRAPM